MVDYAALRRNMVDCQLRTFDVTNRRVLGAMDTVPRELFVPEPRRALAYLDQQVVLAGGRALLTPMVAGRMLQTLDIQPGHSVLDYAGGSGYSAAVAAALGGVVTAFDPIDGMSDLAAGALAAAQAAVSVARAMPAGPFDAIMVNGAAMGPPRALLTLLAEGGKLVVIESMGRTGSVMLYQRSGDVMGKRAVFDAAAPVLEEFRQTPAFAL
jgi:protein-L-isoaspartate(D-aspartate) O-methyltransferase